MDKIIVKEKDELYNYLRNDKNAINTKDILKNDKE